MWYKKVKWSVFGSQNEDYSKPIMDSLLGKDILLLYMLKKDINIERNTFVANHSSVKIFKN